MATGQSFVRRRLRATLTLPQGVFSTGSNTLVIDEGRIEANINWAGQLSNDCSIRIFGMRQSDMVAVTPIFGQGIKPPNINTLARLLVEAGSDQGNWYTVFTGSFYDAQPEFDSAPEVNLFAQANTVYVAQITTPQPTSINKSISGVDLMTLLIQKAGFVPENNFPAGENGGVVDKPYLPGSIMNQIRLAAGYFSINYYVTARGNIAFCPAYQPRTSNKQTVILNAQSGLIGYPKLQKYGLTVRALFNPAFELGVPFTLQGSPISACDGNWFPYQMTMTLESWKPDGRWECDMQCQRNPSGPIPATS